MYAKLQNGFLRSAPKTITLDGHTINNPLPEELEQLGYKPVVYTDMQHGRGHAPPPCGLRACGNGAEPGPLNAGINETGVKAAGI